MSTQHHADPKWGKPPRRPGRYSQAGYSPRGRLNSRDAGSAAAFGLAVQPVIVPMAYAIEHMATQIEPSMGNGMAFGTAYLTSLFLSISLKVVANLLRHNGESMIRNGAAWLWDKACDGVRWVKDWLHEG